MARLIDADALDVHSLPMDMGGCLLIDDVTEMIANAPTIEADHVNHGKWEVGCAGKIRICSNCKESFDDTCNFIERDWQYCPNCGSRMDGDINGKAD